MINLLSYIKYKFPVQLLIILSATWIFNDQGSILNADDLRGYPTSIVFRETEGNASAAQRSIFLFTTDGTVINWTASKNASWITTDLTAGATEGVLKVGVNTTSLMHGIYTGNVVIQSAQSTADPVVVSVTIIINPDVPVTVTTWKDGNPAAMSVSVDSRPSYLTDYYNAGMEVGSHTINHPCFSVTDDRMKFTEIEPNVLAICTGTPEPCKDVISFAWPCGFANYREESDAALYFLSARGYNFNKLEDATPDNFMNLKSYNSHEHDPEPPADLRTVVDTAIMQKKWFNLVQHVDNETLPVDIAYAATQNIWVANIGTVVKYILQRDRVILTDYLETPASISFKLSRLAIPSTVSKNFEQAFGQYDLVTMEIDIDNSKSIENVYVNGVVNPYVIKNINGNLVLQTNLKPETASSKTVEVRYIGTGTGLTVSGITASNKVYDGTQAALLNTSGAILMGVQAGDDVSLVTSGAIGSFTNKNVGTGKTVVTSGFTLTGADAGKYTLTQPSASANITPANLTITGASASSKIYDRTTTSTLNTGSAALAGVLPGDFVTLVKTNAVGTFVNKNVGTNKPVTTSGFTLSGVDAGNYIFAQPSLTASITAVNLTISGVIANDKVYNGTTTAILNTGSAALVGVISGDVVNLVTSGASGNFVNAFPGTAKPVAISGFTITGTDSGNYTLTQPAATANITAAPLTVSGVTVDNKVYDAATAADINTSASVLNGVINGDIVSLVSSGASGSFVNKNTGTGKTVTTTGFTLSGTDASNYTLTQPSLTADITPAMLTVSGVIANNKPYNGNTITTLNGSGASLAGVFSGDIVTLVFTGATGTFVNKNTESGKAVTISGITLGGTDGANYILTQPAATANITPAPLTLSGVIANNKTYDGTDIAVLNTSGATLTVIYGSDVVTLSKISASAAFSDKNIGLGKTVTTSGFTITGADAYNYNLTQPVLTASILARTLTVTADDQFKFFKTTLTFTGTEYSYVGLVADDILSSFTISSSGAPIYAPVGVYPIIVSGGSMPNYNIVYVNGTLSVGKHVVTAKADDKSKTYGSENPVLSMTWSGFMNGEDASVIDNPPSAATVAIPASEPGIYPITLSGGSDDTYSIMLEDGSLDILKALLTITAENKTKIHGEANPELSISYSGFVLGQDQSVLEALPVVESDVVENSDAGEYRITVSGATDNYYEIAFVDGTFTVNKADQVIDFDEIPASMRMTQEVILNASASSGYPVEFRLSDPQKGSLSGNRLTLNKDGKLIVTAVQEGDKNHNPAPDVSQTIDVLPTFDNISSLFTPNADGMNDYWYIPDLEDYGTVKVTVYNRFGQPVYVSASYKNDWDGTWNGDPLPSAAYYYIIKSSSKGFIKGVVNIVR
jgi:gliding motility-associated-like protein